MQIFHHHKKEAPTEVDRDVMDSMLDNCQKRGNCEEVTKEFAVKAERTDSNRFGLDVGFFGFFDIGTRKSNGDGGLVTQDVKNGDTLLLGDGQEKKVEDLPLCDLDKTLEWLRQVRPYVHAEIVELPSSTGGDGPSRLAVVAKKTQTTEEEGVRSFYQLFIIHQDREDTHVDIGDSQADVAPESCDESRYAGLSDPKQAVLLCARDNLEYALDQSRPGHSVLAAQNVEAFLKARQCYLSPKSSGCSK